MKARAAGYGSAQACNSPVKPTHIISLMMTEELLKKYARGEAGEAEKQAVRRYLANHFESMFQSNS